MTNLNHRAVLVCLNRRIWQAATVDRDIAEQAEDLTKAANGTLRVIKELAPKESLSKIRSIADGGYQEHRRMTVPGFVQGQSLLATAMMDRYMTVQGEYKEAFYRAVRAFVDIYPAIVSRAPDRLREAFKHSDFPPQSAISSYFEYQMQFLPVPTVDDWRIDGLADDDREKLRLEADERISAVYNNATKTIFERAKNMLENIARQAADYEGGPGASLLRNVTIDNLREFAETITYMNVTNDPVLHKIGKEMISNFDNITGPEIRANEKMRKDVKNAAQRILKKINTTQKAH